MLVVTCSIRPPPPWPPRVSYTACSVDKDQRPVGKLRTLYPLMNNVQEFDR
jgi:hypothetical protein